MSNPTVETTISGGHIQGIAGAGSVVIENFTIYNRAAEEPAAPGAGAEPIQPCPYPGLAYFGPEDVDKFFGRDAAITRLAQAVERQSFTALIGASGSGKSSVVLAGLAPRLNGTGNWRFSHFRIGAELEHNPFLALARALAPLYVASDSDVERLRNTKLLATSLAAGELTLRDVFADCRSRNKGRRILLIADQFEEAFTFVADDELRHRFIDVLLAGFPDPAAGSVPDICLVLTMRADFFGRALRHRPLADALQNHVENLGPMNRTELQAAIVRPAENAGVAFESGLVETLLDTVQSKPGALPLLQFALREMWGRQERRKITRKSYDEIGGVEGALAMRAETVFDTLSKNGTDPVMDKAFQRLFTRLVTLGEGQADTRRVVVRAELGDEGWTLAQRLAEESNRLVVTDSSSTRETVEVVHEALIRNWPKFVDWINRDRAFQSWLRQIASAIELWSAHPDDEGPLLRGSMLVQATEWLATRRDDLSQKERDFIEASVALRQRTEAEREAARQAEIKRQQELAEAAMKLANEQRRRAKIAFWLGGVAGAAAIVAIALAVFAASERTKAVQATAIAENERNKAVQATTTAENERNKAEQATTIAIKSRDSERQTKNFIARVADTLQALSGVVPEETEALMRQTTEAIVSGNVRDPDALTLQQINALIEMARYFYDAWDTGRVGEFLKDANERLARLSTAAAARPEAARLRAASVELAADANAIYPQTWDQAENSYKRTLALFEAYRKVGPGGELGLARVHRKIATLKVVRNDYAAAATHVDAAYPLLDASEDAQSERANLNDLKAVIAMHGGDFAQAQSLLKEAVEIDRQALERAQQAGRPFQRVSAALATHLQHLGDALRLSGSDDASSSYEQAETLATEVLATYPNQDNTRFMLDLIRHGQSLAYRKGLTKTGPAERIAATEAALDREFGQGFGRFKFGMSTAEVNALFDPPFADVDPKTLPRAGEYLTGDVRYLWIPITKSPDFRDFYDLAANCLTDDLDYVVFLFHEDSLIRISYRLYGPAKSGCRDRRGLLPELAARREMPLLGTPKQWRLEWDTRQVSVVGSTLAQGPKLDIVAR
jgi:hypothetical protein